MFVRCSDRDTGLETIRDHAKWVFLVGSLSSEQPTEENRGINEYDDDPKGDKYGFVEGCAAIEFCYTTTVKVDMNLVNFPFDVQEVPLRIYDCYGDSELVPPAEFFKAGSKHKASNSVVLVRSALVSEEWEMSSPHVTFGEQSDPYETLAPYTQCTVHLKLARKGMGYAVRFVSLMCLMSLGGLLPFLVEPALEPGDSLSYQMGLLFSVIAFQLIVSSFLPVTSTTTIIDFYGMFLFSFVALCMLVITVTSSKFDGNPESGNFWFLLLVWLGFHCWFGAKIQSMLSLRELELDTPNVYEGNAFVIESGQKRGRLVPPDRS
jgi:hypothetical protein